MFQFPLNPIVNQQFTPIPGVTYVFDGTGWALTGGFLTLSQANALYIALTEKAAALGVATLDALIKVPIAQLPAGVANGVASLDGTGKIPAAQLPAIIPGAMVALPRQNLAGTFVDFATPGAKYILLALSNSTGAAVASQMTVRLIGAAVETTGYAGATCQVAGASPAGVNQPANGFMLHPSVGSGFLLHGNVHLTLVDPATNQWTESHTVGLNSSSAAEFGAGTKAMTGGALTGVRLTWLNGTDVFTGGQASCMYWT